LQVIILNAMVVVSWTISYVPIPTSLLLFVAMGLVFFGSFLQTFAALRIHGLVSSAFFCISLADCIMMVVSRRHFVEVLAAHGHQLLLSMIMVVLQALATVGSLYVAASSAGVSLSDVIKRRREKRMRAEKMK